MPKNWADVKTRVYKYYRTQNKSLKDLDRLMIENHDFRRSRRWYLDKINDWGYQKNVRRSPRPNDSVRKENESSAFPPYLNAVNESTSEISFSSVPIVSSPWNWPPTGFLESPLQNTLHPSYTNPQSLQREVSTSRVGSLAYQSSHAGEIVEDTPDIHGQTPLHHAAIKGDLERVRLLLSRDYSIHEKDDYGNQPLHYAAEKQCLGIVDLLLKNGADVNERGAEGKTPLHLAFPSTKVANRLLQEDPTLIAHDDKGNSALHIASAGLSETSNSAACFKIVKMLVRSGYDVNKRNIARETPFHVALSAYNSTNKVVHQVLILFLENKADISLPDTSGKLPFQVFLDRICYYLHKDHVIDLCELFLRYGADPNTVSKGLPLLHKAITSAWKEGRLLELAKRLCETADVNKLADNGDSPLHITARNCHRYMHRDVLNILLRCGARLDQLDNSGESPLMVLLKYSAPMESVNNIITSFINSGANPMLRDRNGDLPVYHVYRSKHWRPATKVLVDSYCASHKPVEECTAYQNDHKWWIEYWHLREEKACFDDFSSRLAGSTHWLPDDIGKDLSRFLLVEAAQEILEDAKQEFLKQKTALGLGTIETLRCQDVIVNVLRECLRIKLDIDQSWYQFTLEFFE
ncbi:hypothetical protein MMC11_006388 [Xylographa trunciseda]|nr:hypothetical protein [Xylographa trunciseda]